MLQFSLELFRSTKRKKPCKWCYKVPKRTQLRTWSSHLNCKSKFMMKCKVEIYFLVCAEWMHCIVMNEVSQATCRAHKSLNQICRRRVLFYLLSCIALKNNLLRWKATPMGTKLLTDYQLGGHCTSDQHNTYRWKPNGNQSLLKPSWRYWVTSLLEWVGMRFTEIHTNVCIKWYGVWYELGLKKR